MIIQKNLPNDWEYLPIRSIFTESDTRCGDNQYDLLSVTQDRGIIKQSDVDIKKDISNDDKSKYKVVLKDSISYNKMRMWQGAVGINEIDDGIVSPAYVVINPKKEINTKFYYYLFKTPYMISQFGKYSYGLVDDMNSLRYDDFQKIYIPIPPIDEQNKIVDYIDKKSVQIEKFIQDKTRFIELLKEQKEAVINEAVTKGLDNSVELKDSEFEWLGEIPKHWEIKKLQYLGNLQNGINIGAEYFGSGFPFVSYGDVYNNYSTPLKVDGLVESTETDRILYSVQEGDVLFTRTSETVEEIGFSSTCLETIEDSTFAGFLIRFRAKKNILHKHYSKYYFRSKLHRGFFVKEMNLVTRASLSQELLKLLPVVLPPIEEQEQIAEYIENELGQIDKLIEKTTKEIELIKEYKISLINEAVSGKIKVV